MKKLILISGLIISLSAYAQTVSGIYLGKLVNDSSKKVQTYELALSEYRGKVTGYSYTTFVSNDTFYYGIKKIKATKNGNQLIVEDDKMIVNNYPEAPAKHVRQINYINLTNEDTLRTVIGKWETNRTKIYYSLHGAMDMKRDNDSSRSTLISHLKELNIIGNDNYNSTDTKVKADTKVKVKEDKTKIKTETKPVEKKEVAIIPYDQRKNNVQKTLEINSDSLELSFYDNGVIDGDSISVYVNGQNIISNVKLTATATKRKIPVSGNEMLIVLAAENLGTLPPNTGLLTIKDGENTYQVNFSADMQTNAAITLRRKLKQ